MHVYQTQLARTRVPQPIVMRPQKLVTHLMVLAIRQTVPARQMMNVVKYMTAVSLGFVLGVMWMVIVALTNVVFYLPVFFCQTMLASNSDLRLVLPSPAHRFLLQAFQD